MIPALLHGKLTLKQENMEDILTSNVFGLLQYVRPECGLFPFIARARALEGDSRPLAHLISKDGPATEAEYDFWPQWNHCQPDVVLSVSGHQRYLVAIEAKYRSGKSSKPAEEPPDNGEADETEGDLNEEPENGEKPGEPRDEGLDDERAMPPSADQLATEWADLVVEASMRGAQPLLLYLTAHLCCPKADVLESINALGEAAVGPRKPMICWLSWRELPRLFRSHSDPHLADIASLADRMELTFFEGISSVDRIQVAWTFHRPTWRFDVAPITCGWRFAQ
jgi:hypothetical protein